LDPFDEREHEFQASVRRAQVGLAELLNGATRTEESSVDRERDDVNEETDAPSEGALPSFPESAWRGTFSVYREALAGASESSDAAKFGSFWAIAACCLRRRVWIRYAYPIYPNVYILVFGGTGEGKTTAGRHALHQIPLHAPIKVSRGMGSAEAFADWLTPTEGGPVLSHLLVQEEFSTLMARANRDGSTITSFMVEAFDAPDAYEARYRKNPIYVPEPTVSMLAGTTPDWFWRSVTDAAIHGGFGNRLFYLTGPPHAPIPWPVRPDPSRLAEVSAALLRLTEHRMAELRLPPEAHALWEEFYSAWRASTWDELTSAATKRIPEYILKLALLTPHWRTRLTLIMGSWRPPLPSAGMASNARTS
jgi:hypothetical protein